MGKLSQNSVQRQRNGLLGKVHMAAADLGLIDKTAHDADGNPNDDYHMVLKEEFGVASASALSNRELERLIARFEACGWKPRRQRPEVRGQRTETAQADALKERIGQELMHSDMTEKRLHGLVREICGVDDLRWCGDAVRLKRLLAVIGNMIERGDIRVFSPGVETPRDEGRPLR